MDTTWSAASPSAALNVLHVSPSKRLAPAAVPTQIVASGPTAIVSTLRAAAL
jgi:hypothetical protein